MKFSKKYFQSICFGIMTLSLLSIAIFSLVSFINTQENEADALYKEAFNRNYKIYSPLIKDSLSFAGEKVPMEIFHVRERYDRELLVNTYWQSNTILMIKRANRWFPVIEPILKEEGVPDDFKYLAMIESSFINQVSSARAAGFWQFIKPTAQLYKLEVNEFVDERNHVEKSTHAACRYLQHAYARFGSWTLVAASYNTGEGNINYHVRTQEISDYYQMHLPDETLRYVFRILAMKEIYEHPADYGLFLREQDMYEPLKVKTIEVDTAIPNLFAFAKTQGVSYQILKMYNPWLRARNLPNKSQKKYSIELPI
ncbi:MAG: lytic transglycosylase domain-containing protein [Bacteroidales bacterium]